MRSDRVVPPLFFSNNLFPQCPAASCRSNCTLLDSHKIPFIEGDCYPSATVLPYGRTRVTGPLRRKPALLFSGGAGLGVAKLAGGQKRGRFDESQQDDGTAGHEPGRWGGAARLSGRADPGHEAFCRIHATFAGSGLYQELRRPVHIHQPRLRAAARPGARYGDR